MLVAALTISCPKNATLDEAIAVAVKRVIAWLIKQEMKAQNLNKTPMAKKMHTSRAALNRLLDENDTSLTLASGLLANLPA